MKTKIIGIFVFMLLIATAVPAVESIKNNTIIVTVANQPLPFTAVNWTETQKILADDGATLDCFGASVSVDGDTALIGAYWDDDNGVDSGSVYVFTRTGSTWTQQTKLLASDGAAGDAFGYTVSLDGDTALIAASLDDDNGESSGSAYVFTRTGTTWTEQAKLLPLDGVAGDNLCWVSLNGDTALLGVPGDDDNGEHTGSAYVFTRTETTWTQEAKLLAADGAAQDWFGYGVSIDGDTALIGSELDDDSGTDSGSAYICSFRDNLDSTGKTCRLRWCCRRPVWCSCLSRRKYRFYRCIIGR